MNVDLLKESYNKNRIVKAICDHMASSLKNQTETKKHKIIEHLCKKGCIFNDKEIIAAFRLLQNAGCGKYVEGRHGRKSRFIWCIKSKNATQYANSEKVIEHDNLEDSQNLIVEHIYMLRPDLCISYESQINLTSIEANYLN